MDHGAGQACGAGRGAADSGCAAAVRAARLWRRAARSIPLSRHSGAPQRSQLGGRTTSGGGLWARAAQWAEGETGRAAHRIPPIANIGNGPSGLTYYPGTGFGDRYSDMFLMCDFKGTPSRSGIHAIRNAPFGAHFMVEKQEQVIYL